MRVRLLAALILSTAFTASLLAKGTSSSGSHSSGSGSHSFNPADHPRGPDGKFVPKGSGTYTPGSDTPTTYPPDPADPTTPATRPASTSVSGGSGSTYHPPLIVQSTSAPGGSSASTARIPVSATTRPATQPAQTALEAAMEGWRNSHTAYLRAKADLAAAREEIARLKQELAVAGAKAAR